MGKRVMGPKEKMRPNSLGHLTSSPTEERTPLVPGQIVSISDEGMGSGPSAADYEGLGVYPDMVPVPLDPQDQMDGIPHCVHVHAYGRA